MIKDKGFEGWYFKHQLQNDMIAFIPGRAESGAFVQLISSSGSRHFKVPELSVNRNTIRAGNSLFSPRGCKINLPGVIGEIRYSELTPLRSDIMGPFQFLPMECRHGIISMGHLLSGSLTVDGIVHNFDGGKGYIEKDSGTSFPKFYQWLQCNDFTEPCSLVVSIAHIPFLGVSFTGCICAIVHRGREYRLATYQGVRILSADETHICLSQRSLLLEINVKPSSNGHPLRAPANGQMSDIIHESLNSEIHVRFWEHGKLVFSLKSSHATYEYVN